MGSGASIHVEPYLDNDTASLSDESMDDISIASMDTANMSDESDSENESLFNVLSTFTKVLRGCFGHFYKSATMSERSMIKYPCNTHSRLVVKRRTRE